MFNYLFFEFFAKVIKKYSIVFKTTKKVAFLTPNAIILPFLTITTGVIIIGQLQQSIF